MAVLENGGGPYEAGCNPIVTVPEQLALPL